MSEQLELFSALPLGLQPPRRLRILGFSLACLDRLRAEGEILRRRIGQNEIMLAVAVAEARLFGDVIPDAYACAVDIEETSEKIARNTRKIDEARADIDRELSRMVEKYLRHQDKLATG